jgi:hypothetical protein
MAQDKPKTPPKNAGEARQRRVARALKANLQRRKAANVAPELDKLANTAKDGLPLKQ